MERWLSVLRDVSLAEFSVLAVITVWQWRRSRVRGAGWAAVTFSMLATVSVSGRVLPHLPQDIPMEWAIKVLLAILLLVPYALFRFAATFQRPRRTIWAGAAALTVFVIAWTVQLPYIPGPGAPLSGSFVAYRLAIGVQWIVLFTFVATRLWAAGAEGSTPVRRRTRLLAAAAIGMDVPLAIGALGLGHSVRVQMVSQSVGVISAALFALALAPPAALRLHWRRKEQDALRDAVAELVGATSASQAAARILPHAAAVTGACGAVLVDEHGQVMATFGEDVDPDADGAGIVRAPFQRGAFVMRSSSYAPFFGRDEVELLKGLGYFMDLALDRCSSGEWEREFIDTAAHELRTPLTVLAGLATTLSAWRERMSPEKIGECLEAMERQGARAGRLVNALLDLAHLDRGSLQLTIEPVHIGMAVTAAVEAVPVPVDTELALLVPGDLVVAADRGRLDQVLVNLLSNAVRHGGAHIAVAARRTADMVEVTVSDDGPGVDPDLAPRIFQPFARGKEAGGSGLGLAISHRVVQASGGSIHYEPRHPSGCRFVLRLPAADTAISAPDATHRPGRRRAREPANGEGRLTKPLTPATASPRVGVTEM